MKSIIILFITTFYSNLHAQDFTYKIINDTTYIVPRQSENPDSIAHIKHNHPLPLECAEIKSGSSNDALVLKLYGKGLFDKNDGHGGARYFIDPKKKVILKTVIGVDHVIEEVGLTSCNFPFDFVSKQLSSIPISENLNESPLLIKDIQFGDTAEKVIKAFGVPNHDKIEKDVRTVVYEDSYEEWEGVLFYSATFEFRKNKLEQIVIYNGE